MTAVTDVTIRISGLLPQDVNKDRLLLLTIDSVAGAPNAAFSLSFSADKTLSMRINENALDSDNGATLVNNVLTLQPSFFMGGFEGYLPVFIRGTDTEMFTAASFIGTKVSGIPGTLTVQPNTGIHLFDTDFQQNITDFIFKDIRIAVSGDLPTAPGTSSTLQVDITCTTFDTGPPVFRGLLLRPEYGRFADVGGGAIVTDKANGVTTSYTTGWSGSGTGPFTLSFPVLYTLPLGQAIDTNAVLQDFQGPNFVNLDVWINSCLLVYNKAGPAGTTCAGYATTITIDLSGFNIPSGEVASSELLSAVQQAPNESAVDYYAVADTTAAKTGLTAPQAVVRVGRGRQALLERNIPFGTVVAQAPLVADGLPPGHTDMPVVMM